VCKGFTNWMLQYWLWFKIEDGSQRRTLSGMLQYLYLLGD
jgi:hypothetical protein